MFGIDRGYDRRRAASFGLEFVRSEAFAALFQEGMELVEETANYLDGPGRADCAMLTSEQARAYTDESVQLTSRLMQVTTWLLAQRALAEGTLTAQEVAAECARLRPLAPVETPIALFDTLPKTFCALSGLTARLYARIQHLQDLLFEADGIMPAAGNPVAEQRWLIEQAFKRARRTISAA